MANEYPATPRERRALSIVLKRFVATEFDGNNKSAYTQAKVNAGTWSRLLAGESVKPYIVVRVVNTFWPEAEGDWRRVPTVDIEETSTVEELMLEIDRLTAELMAAKKHLTTDSGEVRKAPSSRSHH